MKKYAEDTNLIGADIFIIEVDQLRPDLDLPVV
jgi:hypothetical protein